MKDAAELAARLASAAAGGERVVLATVVATAGSAYRRPGAWLVVGEDGARTGQVSAGCLEADVVERARAIADDAPLLLTYDLRGDEEVPWSLGTGCPGVVRLLVEPLAGVRLASAATLFAHAAERTTPASLVTVLESRRDDVRVGDRALLSTAGELEAGALPARLLAAVSARVATGFLGEVREPDVTLSIAGLTPKTRLLLCGAGDDAVPVAALGRELGWDVAVVDHRPALASAARFPGARVAHIACPAFAPPLVTAPSFTAAIVMTHSFENDVAYAAALLPLELPYLGLLGPRRRGALVEQRARARAGLGGDEGSRVFAPVGLDIGAESPREIAMAAVGEVTAVLAGRRGGSLAERSGPIHGVERAARAVVSMR